MITRPLLMTGTIVLAALAFAACGTPQVSDDEGASVGKVTQGIQGGSVDSSNKYRFNVGLCFGGRGNCRGAGKQAGERRGHGEPQRRRRRRSAGLTTSVRRTPKRSLTTTTSPWAIRVPLT